MMHEEYWNLQGIKYYHYLKLCSLQWKVISNQNNNEIDK